MGKYTFNDDGSLGYKKGFLQSFFGGGNAEQLQVHQYNQALKQYNEQFQFQKDQFDFNKGVSEFNMNLANRQQAMQEEAYYNGVSNQAKQLGALGINPASQGQALSSGPSMSAGSNVSGASAGSTSATAGFDAFGSSKVGLDMLSLLASIKKMKSDEKIADKQADIAQYNAETSRISAESSRDVDKSTIAVNQRNMESSLIRDSYTIAQEMNIHSQTEYQRMINSDRKETKDRLGAFHINQNDLEMFKNMDWQVAIIAGVYSIFGNAGKNSNYDSNQVPITLAEWETVLENAQSYNSLAPRQKEVVDRFYDDFGIENGIGKDFPASNLVEWRRSGYQDYQIYEGLMKYYDVKGSNPYNSTKYSSKKTAGKFHETSIY